MNFIFLARLIWKYKNLIIAVGIIALFVFYVWLADKRGRERDELLEAVKGYKQVVADMQTWHNETIKTLERKATNDRERSDFESAATADVEKNRAAGDGPLAPVLRDGVRLLWKRQADNQARNP